MDTPKKLVILQDDRKLTLIPEGRDTVTVIPDGKEHKTKTLLGETDVKGEWKELSLVLTTTINGHDVTRIYRIDDEGRLEVATEIKLQTGDKIEIVSRYDEAKSP